MSLETEDTGYTFFLDCWVTITMIMWGHFDSICKCRSICRKPTTASRPLCMRGMENLSSSVYVNPISHKLWFLPSLCVKCRVPTSRRAGITLLNHFPTGCGLCWDTHTCAPAAGASPVGMKVDCKHSCKCDFRAWESRARLPHTGLTGCPVSN